MALILFTISLHFKAIRPCYNLPKGVIAQIFLLFTIVQSSHCATFPSFKKPSCSHCRPGSTTFAFEGTRYGICNERTPSRLVLLERLIRQFPCARTMKGRVAFLKSNFLRPLVGGLRRTNVSNFLGILPRGIVIRPCERNQLSVTGSPSLQVLHLKISSSWLESLRVPCKVSNRPKQSVESD